MAAIFSRGDTSEDKNVLQFLDVRTLLRLRQASQQASAAVARCRLEHAGGVGRLSCASQVRGFRKCFPLILSVKVRAVKSGADFPHMRGLHSVHIISSWPAGAVTAEDFAQLGPELRHLTVPAYASLPRASFSALFGLRSLELLRCDCRALVDADFAALSQLESLVLSAVLGLSRDGAFLRHLASLRELCVEDMVVSCAAVMGLGGTLEKLELMRCGVWDGGQASFEGMSKLKALSLSFCGGIPAVALSALPPSVTDLRLMYPTGLTDETFEAFKHVTRLSYWQTVGRAGEEEAVTWQAFTNLSSVQHLHVEGPPLNDAGPVSKCPLNDDALAVVGATLTHLGIVNCIQVEDGGLCAVGDSLVSLAVGGSHSVSNAGLARLHRLRHLSLCGLVDAEFTAEGIAALAELSGLQTITLPDCALRDALSEVVHLQSKSGDGGRRYRYVETYDVQRRGPARAEGKGGE